ncbi:flagellar hook-length control protein FliK [Vreelandella arcis]|uniref:Flagellar hook-length control protein FliK n=1 Tax=Vreelandella arcis TaxID=416873 RepID=A0A1H0AWY6_9GAMM|nr:flagellar hook-length control protein FliK [Halomonas arcis]SDN37972.1 flagellar hook-length control protein FliK [Halomonas arcis]
MNIHQLLSTTQGQATSSQPGSTATADGVRGFFQQALSQASASPHQRLANSPVTPSLNQADLNNAGNGNAADASSLSAMLESLGLDISPEALEKLMARFSSADSASVRDDMAALETSGRLENATLDDIAQRLSLMASFGDATQDLGTDDAPPTAAELAQQLGIKEGEAEQLVSLLSAFVAVQGQGANATTNTSSAGSPRTLGDIAQALGATSQQAEGGQSSRADDAKQLRADNPLLNQVDTRANTRSAPENWVSALDTSARADGAKANPMVPSTASESLLSGLSSANGGQTNGQPGIAPTASTLGSAANPTSAAVNTPVTSPAWPQQLGQQLVQFAQRGGDQLVQMQLHPAELGPLSISLKFGEQGAQAHFLSGHAQVRQVIEQAIPQLREALAEQGISLGETSVGEQRQSSEQGLAQQQSGPGGQPSAEGGEEGGRLASTSPSTPITLDGRVDLYA